ncbi:hypothetical protein BVX97_04680 [bacterium E08(2017)]|nr:hypothetical protein BVX97_04680 [bacterium E08(2017)]
MNIEGFEIIEKIADGSTGTVWKANQVSLNRIVAIKTLHEHLTGDPFAVEAFLTNARKGATIKDDNVIQTFDVSESNGIPYYVMEYVDGHTITEILESDDDLSFSHTLKIGLAIGYTLEQAWVNQNVIHTCLTPDSVMIDHSGNVKIAKLGHTTKYDASSVTSAISEGAFKDTAHYVAPEQATLEPHIDFRANMYNLGAILYYMLTGVKPFEGQDPIDVLQHQVSSQIKYPRDIAKDLPPAACNIIVRLMMKHPAHRYNNWEEATEDLNKALKTKMAIQAKLPENAVSTVINPKAEAAARAAKRQTAEHPGPILGVRVLAWSLLFIVFISLTIILYRSTARRRLAQTDAINNENMRAAAEAASARRRHEAQQNRRRPRRSQPAITHESSPNMDDDIDNSERMFELPDAYTARPLTDITPADDMEDSADDEGVDETGSENAGETSRLSEVKQEVLEHLMKRDISAAENTVSTALSGASSNTLSTELDKLQRLLQDMKGIEESILASFRAKVGETITIEHKRRDINIQIRSVDDTQINAVFLNKVGDKIYRKPVRITMAQLDPVEIINRMDSSGPQEARNAYKYILYSKMNNPAAAGSISAHCGALSDVFSSGNR